MLKVLLRVRLMAFREVLYKSKKPGVRRGTAGAFGMAILFLFLALSLFMAFLGVSAAMSPLIEAGQVWLYFALMGMISIALGTVGSVFSTFSGLYKAKDNELLLSMPVPPRLILLSRMIPVYGLSFLYSALVWLPASIRFWVTSSPNTPQIVLPLVLTFFIGLAVTVLSCFFGWLVALLSSKVRNKNLATIVLSLVFLIGYYVIYFRINTLLQQLLLYADTIGSAVSGWLFPVYVLALGASGKVGSALIFMLIQVVLFAVCWWILSRTFLKIATTGSTAKKKEFRETEVVRTSTAGQALFRRELKHFVSSPACMLNCGLGLLVMLFLAVFSLIKAPVLREKLATLAAIPFVTEALPVLVACAVCLLVSMDPITAPSVSLEGKRLWIVRTLPVETKEILQAKVKLHTLLNAIPAVICTVAFGIALQVSLSGIVFAALTVLTYIWFTGDLGLFLNLQKPNLDWTNETVPVKQSLAVLISIFGGWALCIVMGGGWYLLKDKVSAETWLIAWLVIYSLVHRLMTRWLNTRGVALFEAL